MLPLFLQEFIAISRARSHHVCGHCSFENLCYETLSVLCQNCVNYPSIHADPGTSCYSASPYTLLLGSKILTQTEAWNTVSQSILNRYNQVNQTCHASSIRQSSHICFLTIGYSSCLSIHSGQTVAEVSRHFPTIQLFGCLYFSFI